MKLLVATFLLVCLGATNARETWPSHGTRIIGGQPVTSISTLPYHAAIEMAFIGNQICSAAIISSKWLVTSGHCVALLLPIDIQVRVGTVRYGFGGTVYEVSDVIQHPLFVYEWYTSVDYDVGVVGTAMPMVFSQDVKPIALPLRNTELAVGEPVSVSGWGVISSGDGAQPPRTLQIATLGIVSRPSCNLTEQYIGNITYRMLCAGSQAQDVCAGDNGGALVLANVAYGVASWGLGCGVKQFLSVFTNLGNAEIRDFITEVTQV